MATRVTLPTEPDKYTQLSNRLLSWYVQAKPGEWYTYYIGMSLHDSLAVEKVREIAWGLACQGKVYLFLKRHPTEKNSFMFLCQRSRKPTPRLVPKPSM